MNEISRSKTKSCPRRLTTVKRGQAQLAVVPDKTSRILEMIWVLTHISAAVKRSGRGQYCETFADGGTFLKKNCFKKPSDAITGNREVLNIENLGKVPICLLSFLLYCLVFVLSLHFFDGFLRTLLRKRFELI